MPHQPRGIMSIRGDAGHIAVDVEVHVGAVDDKAIDRVVVRAPFDWRRLEELRELAKVHTVARGCDCDHRRPIRVPVHQVRLRPLRPGARRAIFAGVHREHAEQHRAVERVRLHGGKVDVARPSPVVPVDADEFEAAVWPRWVVALRAHHLHVPPARHLGVGARVHQVAPAKVHDRHLAVKLTRAHKAECHRAIPQVVAPRVVAVKDGGGRAHDIVRVPRLPAPRQHVVERARAQQIHPVSQSHVRFIQMVCVS
mmetsp:Transcript_18985/g.48953  ORF Transcript_18985/g.48953 Transcript_18985/m.48953 type:complete len:254 (-) Transcript_18985:545-1306(-)